MKRSDPPQPIRPPASSERRTQDQDNASRKGASSTKLGGPLVVALGLGLFAVPALVLLLLTSPKPRTDRQSTSERTTKQSTLFSKEDGNKEARRFGNARKQEQSTARGNSSPGDRAQQPEASNAGVEAGGALGDEDWNGRIERFDENARLFDERLALFDQERSLGLTNPKREREVESFFVERLVALSPRARPEVKCTPSVCEVHLLSDGSVGALVADMGPLLRELETEATGNPRSTSDDGSSFRLLFRATDAPSGGSDEPLP